MNQFSPPSTHTCALLSDSPLVTPPPPLQPYSISWFSAQHSTSQWCIGQLVRARAHRYTQGTSKHTNKRTHHRGALDSWCTHTHKVCASSFDTSQAWASQCRTLYPNSLFPHTRTPNGLPPRLMTPALAGAGHTGESGRPGQMVPPPPPPTHSHKHTLLAAWEGQSRTNLNGSP